MTSQQEKDRMRSQLLRQIAKGAINMKFANELCPECPANKQVENGSAKTVRNYCVKYRWNLEKIMKVNGKVPCNEKATTEEAKELYGKVVQPVGKKFIPTS